MKTQNEVREYALAAKDWLYVWGANGEELTQSLINRLYSDYGSTTYTYSYYSKKLIEGAGKKGADCSGFMLPLSGYDDTAQGYYNSCIEKDTIGSIPEDTVCLVFKKNKSGRMYHIGIYLGDGTVAEMASSALNYQHKPLKNNGWTHWGIPKWIDYSNEGEWIQAKDGRWWYRRGDGSYPADGWEVIDHHWYLFDKDGWMLTGWQQVNGEIYYLQETNDDNLQGACWHEAPGGRGNLERWYVE